VPLDVVVEFKRGVYEMALTELARYLPRQDFRNRFLRGNVRGREFDRHPAGGGHEPGFELPPGATFEPDPNVSAAPESAATPATNPLLASR